MKLSLLERRAVYDAIRDIDSGQQAFSCIALSRNLSSYDGEKLRYKYINFYTAKREINMLDIDHTGDAYISSSRMRVIMLSLFLAANS